MNKYEVVISDTDSLGIEFFQNSVKIAHQGGVLKEGVNVRLQFPRAAVFEISTEEFLESKLGFQVVPVEIEYTKEMLEAMDWETFKTAVAAKGVKGRSRDPMTAKYLKACETGVLDSSEEE